MRAIHCEHKPLPMDQSVSRGPHLKSLRIRSLTAVIIRSIVAYILPTEYVYLLVADQGRARYPVLENSTDEYRVLSS